MRYIHRTKQFHTHWKRGEHNLGDYPTKRQLAKHHRTVHPIYVENPAKKINKYFTTTIIQFQSVCKVVLNTKPKRKWVLQNIHTNKTDKQTHYYQLLFLIIVNPINTT